MRLQRKPGEALHARSATQRFLFNYDFATADHLLYTAVINNARFISSTTDLKVTGLLIEVFKLPEKDRNVLLIEVFYILSTGCQWQALPRDLPPRSMVHEYLKL